MNTKHIRYMNLSDKATLTSYIEATIIKAKTLKDRIQVASVGVLMNVGKHGDKPTAITLANKMINELGQGIQTKALADWFLEFGFTLNPDADGFGDIDLDKVKANFQRAKATHWCTFAPQTAWSGFNLDDKLESLFKAATQAQDKASLDTEAASVVSIDQNKLAVLQFIAGLDNTQLQQAMQTLDVSASTVSTADTVTEDFEADTETVVAA